MLDYTNAKPSLFIEDELPSFVKSEGANFILFLKTYYDWLEKKIVILNLKSQHDITDANLNLDYSLFSLGEYLVTEDSTTANTYFICDESQANVSIFSSNTSLYFNGANNYMEVSNNIIDFNSSFTLGTWINIDKYPSVALHDYDVVTLSSNNYVALVSVTSSDNKVKLKYGANVTSTDISLGINKWYYIVTRFDKTINRLRYDIFDNVYDGVNVTQKSFYIDGLSTLSTNMIAFGYNKYNSSTHPNFLDGKLNNVSIWNKYLTDSEIISIYNTGTPVNILANTGNYVSSAFLTNFWNFDTANSTIVVNSKTPVNNGNLYNNPQTVTDVPFNLKVYQTEYEEYVSILLNYLSHISYEGFQDGTVSTRMKVFAEHIRGNLKENTIINSTANNTVIIDTFEEARNSIFDLNNMPNYQDIDYAFKIENFISDSNFQYLWKELLNDFPMYLYTTHERSIKNIIGKRIKDFYSSKGTTESIKYLFKIFFNEDVTIVQNSYLEYTVKTKKYASSEITTLIKNLSHPIGFKVNFVSPTA